MRKIAIAVFTVALAACGKSSIETKLDEAAKLRDRMCDCKDAECANAVQEDFRTWKKGNKKSSDDKPSDDQMKRWSSINDELIACRHKLESPK